MRLIRNFRLLALIMVVLLGLSLLLPTPAAADDITPPPTEEAAEIPTEETETQFLPADETPAAVPDQDDAPVTSPLATEDPSAVLPELPHAPTEEPLESLPEVLDEMPQDTEVVVLADERIEPLESLPEVLDEMPQDTEVVVLADERIEPLATQVAANAFVEGDPMWCPEGVAPGGAGCTASYLTLYELIDAIDNGTESEPNQNGIIWILFGTDSSSHPISIDGADFGTWRNFELTLQGGWSGPVGSNSVFHQPIEIAGWKNNVTINDIAIIGTVSSGLTIQTDEDVYIKNLSSNQNAGEGAEIQASDVYFQGTNKFNQNDGTGVYINAVGVVHAPNDTIINASGNGGGGYGNGAEFTAHALELWGTNTFNENRESGLFANVNGNVTLSNVTANMNGKNGSYGAGVEVISSGTFTLTGANVFSGNLSEGLSVTAGNGIFIYGAQLVNNLEAGAYLVSSGDILLDCSTVVSNGGYGIDANAPRLTLNGVLVAQNGDEGVSNSGSIVWNSNSCYSYSDGGDGRYDNIITKPSSLPVNVLVVQSGADVDLKCRGFGGSSLSFSNGNGVYIPCEIGEVARLIDLTQNSIPDHLPRGYRLISGLSLDIFDQGNLLEPMSDSNSIWYWDSGIDSLEGATRNSQALYWDGDKWVEVDAGVIPFIHVFFRIPEGAEANEFAVLYWDGTGWMELTDNLNLGNGRFVRRGGYVRYPYFETEVNFIGAFVLAQKK